MLESFDKSLSELEGTTVVVSEGDWYPNPEQASVDLFFSNRTRLSAEYWRLIVNARASVSSFDHRQKYGLPAPINAVKTLQETLNEKIVARASLDRKTGDLLFEFVGGISLQILNFTGYEIWKVSFPDGSGEYSNYVK